MDTKLTNTINKASAIAKLFIAWNVAFFIVALLMKHTVADDAIGAVLLRGGVYAVGGLILLALLRGMGKGQRGAWLRLSIISILAPLGVIAFIIFTPHLPIWFDAGQVGSALMLAAIAVLILHQDIRKSFPKKPKNK